MKGLLLKFFRHVFSFIFYRTYLQIFRINCRVGSATRLNFEKYMYI